MPGNNHGKSPVPGALRNADVQRCRDRPAYLAYSGEPVRFDTVSARFLLPPMQMGNTAKHILTCHCAVNQFSQQSAISFDSAARMFPQAFHRRNDRSYGLTAAAYVSDSRRNTG